MPSDLDRMLDECERTGNCTECRLPPATKAEWERHDREHPKACPLQAGTGECWCLTRCWCSHPELDGPTARERRLVAIVRVLRTAMQDEQCYRLGLDPALYVAMAEAERIATEGA